MGNNAKIYTEKITELRWAIIQRLLEFSNKKIINRQAETVISASIDSAFYNSKLLTCLPSFEKIDKIAVDNNYIDSFVLLCASSMYSYFTTLENRKLITADRDEIINNFAICIDSCVDDMDTEDLLNNYFLKCDEMRKDLKDVRDIFYNQGLLFFSILSDGKIKPKDIDNSLSEKLSLSLAMQKMSILNSDLLNKYEHHTI